MKTSENLISNFYFVENTVAMFEILHKSTIFSIWNFNRMLLTVKLLLYPLFGYHRHSYSYGI